MVKVKNNTGYPIDLEEKWSEEDTNNAILIFQTIIAGLKIFLKYPIRNVFETRILNEVEEIAKTTKIIEIKIEFEQLSKTKNPEEFLNGLTKAMSKLDNLIPKTKWKEWLNTKTELLEVEKIAEIQLEKYEESEILASNYELLFKPIKEMVNSMITVIQRKGSVNDIIGIITGTTKRLKKSAKIYPEFEETSKNFIKELNVFNKTVSKLKSKKIKKEDRQQLILLETKEFLFRLKKHIPEYIQERIKIRKIIDFVQSCTNKKFLELI
ncbi:hypothetical protein DRJ25_00965 [Candidatus Woesearchaeota archaeon]|nr:MAG: hypothetical protein DRJ25_00965 [Candidatus Woesearchaeota archaeon]